MPVRTSDIVQDELKRLHDTTGDPWRKMASLDNYTGIPAGTLCSIAKTGEVPKKWRKRLGMPVPASVTPVSGEIPEGSQALRADLCACGRYFISNHPRRRKCFVCSPFRKRS
jgi:hypothetical protein